MKLNLTAKVGLLTAVPVLLLGLCIGYYTYKSYKEELTTQKRTQLRELVNLASTKALKTYKLSENSSEFKRKIRDDFANVRFEDGTNYFFIYDFNGITLSNIKESLIGKDLYNLRDKNGKFILQEFIKLVKSDAGEGVFDYLWPSKEDENKLVTKLAYAKRIGDSPYFIGAGVYTNDIDALISKFVKNNLIVMGLGILLTLVVAVFFVRKMIVNPLVSLQSELRASGESLSNYSNGMVATSETLSKSTNELSASLDETSASMEEINAMIERNVEHSKESEEYTTNTSEVVAKGMRVVEEMTNAVNDISEGNKEVSHKMENNTRRTEEILGYIKSIEEKTKVINDIVFQTKLLSFNASVEAARAGEQGKGFAVVAEEVGNLATMSGTSAEEISKLLESSISHIESIVKEAKSDTKEILNITESKVRTGMEVAANNKETLTKINDNVSNVNLRVKSISEASQEQSLGVSEVNEAVRSLDGIAKSNLENASKASSIAKELGGEAQNIEEIIKGLNRVLKG